MRSEIVVLPPGFRVEPRVDGMREYIVVYNQAGRMLRRRYSSVEAASSAVRRSAATMRVEHPRCPVCKCFSDGPCKRHDGDEKSPN